MGSLHRCALDLHFQLCQHASVGLQVAAAHEAVDKALAGEAQLAEAVQRAERSAAEKHAQIEKNREDERDRRTALAVGEVAPQPSPVRSIWC